MVVADASCAASFEARVEALFRPPLAERAALSPDGQRVAYTRPSGRDLALVIENLEQTEPKRTVRVNFGREATAGAEAAAPLPLRFLRWTAGGRLVFAPVERVVPLPPVPAPGGGFAPNPDGPTIVSPILAMDADGKRRGTLVDARDFLETSADARSLADLLRTPQELRAIRTEPVRWRMPHLDILGFVPGDGEQLVIGTRGGLGEPAQYLVDTRLGSVRAFGGDWAPPPGEPQVFDWFRHKVVGVRQEAVRPSTAWQDEELRGVQRELERKFPRRAVELLDWSETRARVLFRVTGGSDPGRIFVYQRPEDLALEVLRCAPWLSAAKLNETRFFEFAALDGARLSGLLTWPRNPRGRPPPLVVVLPSGFPGWAQPAFDPEAEVLADLGFGVVRLNHRGAAGVRAEDLGGLRAAVDRVSLDDVRRALEWLSSRFPERPFDRGRVATLGRGFGGYLAVRALQLHPALFRCGIAIDAPLDLRPWLHPPTGEAGRAPGRLVRALPPALLDPAAADWRRLSVVAEVETLTQPVLLLAQPGRDPVVDESGAALRDRLRELGRSVERLELEAGLAAAPPPARAAAYRRMEEFLHRCLPAAAEGEGR